MIRKLFPLLLCLSSSPVLADVASFSVVDYRPDASGLFTIGLPLAEGQVPAGADLRVITSNGTPLESQWNPLAQWRTDDSQLHGALTFNLPASADGKYRVVAAAVSGDAPTVSSITKQDIVAAGFRASVEVRVEGYRYLLRAEDLLSGKVEPLQDYTHFTGPLAAEFVLGGPLRFLGHGTETEGLQAFFHIRAFGRPVENVHVTMVLENTGVHNSLKDRLGDVTLTVDGQDRYQRRHFRIGADKRYPKRFWWKDDPGVWVRHDTEAIQDSRLTPEYRDVWISESALQAFPRRVDWHERGHLNAAMDSGGAQKHIAPLDSWSAAYLISGDKRAYDAMRVHDDVYHWLVSNNRFAMNTRDENTGFPVDLAREPQLVGFVWDGQPGSKTVQAYRRNENPVKTNLAHEPANGYLTYLLTAEYDALESAQLWAVSAWLRERPGSFAGWPRSFYHGEVRAVGWGLRNIVNAAVITPRSHPLYKTLDQAVLYALDSLGREARVLDDQAATGLLLTGPGIGAAIHELDANGRRTGIKPWMQDYLTWAIGSAYERGYAAELTKVGLWAWASQSIVKRLGAKDGFCWAYGASYSLEVMDSLSKFTDWQTIMHKNFGPVGCPDEGAEMLHGDRDATDYAAQMAAPLAIAVDTKIPGADRAWRRYEKRKRAWSYDFDTRPEFAIMPRN